MIDTTDSNEKFYSSLMVLVPEGIFLAGDQIENDYKNRLFGLFDECTSDSDFIVNSTDDYKFLHALEERNPEWFDNNQDTAKNNLFELYEGMGHEVDRRLNTIVFKNKYFYFIQTTRTARLVNYQANAKITKKLTMQPKLFMLLYYMSFILCSVFTNSMINSIVKKEINMADLFDSKWIRATYKKQFSMLLQKIESTLE